LLDNDNFIMESIKLEKKVMKKDVDFESFVTGKEVEVKVRMSSTNPVSPHPRFDASYSNRNINFDQSRKKIFLPKNDVCLYAVAITDWGFSSSFQGYMWKYIVDDIGDNDDIYFGLIIRNKINPDNISEIKELGSNNFSWGYCPGKGIYKHNEKISNSNKKKIKKNDIITLRIKNNEVTFSLNQLKEDFTMKITEHESVYPSVVIPEGTRLTLKFPLEIDF